MASSLARNYDLLSKKLASESYTRKRELSHLRMMLKLQYTSFRRRDAAGNIFRDYEFEGELFENSEYHWAAACNRRAMYVLTYAHWEGYTKSAFTHYLYFLDQLGQAETDLHPCLAAYMKSADVPVVESASAYDLTTESARKAAGTRANLDFAFAQKLWERFDLEFPESFIAEKETIKHLVAMRHGIAHGDPDSEYSELVKDDKVAIAKSVDFVNEFFEILTESILLKAELFHGR